MQSREVTVDVLGHQTVLMSHLLNCLLGCLIKRPIDDAVGSNPRTHPFLRNQARPEELGLAALPGARFNQPFLTWPTERSTYIDLERHREARGQGFGSGLNDFDQRL
jgi:hypothetical protein